MHRTLLSTPALLLAAACLAVSPVRAADGNSHPTFWGDGRYTGSTAPDDWPKLTSRPNRARQSSEPSNVARPTES